MAAALPGHQGKGLKKRHAIQARDPALRETPEPETPYQSAAQLWDERIGSARVQARNWRLMAFGGLFLTCLSSALVWQSMQSRVVPYVVEVDPLGEARAVAAGGGELPADRSADRLAPGAIHHEHALAVARCRADARELAVGL